MIKIHAGLPKTGTTSLQKRLHTNTAVLEDHGWSYPKEWTGNNYLAHHSLSLAVLNDEKVNNDYISSFINYLAEKDDSNILISSEGFTNCIQPRALERFIKFLSLCDAHGGAGILLVLRRMDKFLESMYLHSTKYGRHKMGLLEYIKNMDRWSDNFFSGLARIHKLLPSIQFEYFKHSGRKDILDDVFRSLGIQDCMNSFVSEKKAHNIRLGAKAQSFLLEYETFCDAHKLRADRVKWIRAFESGDVIFPGEIFRYSILTAEQSGHIRDHALKAAHTHGVGVYNEYFDSEPVEESPYIQYASEGLITKSDIEWLRDIDSRLSI